MTRGTLDRNISTLMDELKILEGMVREATTFAVKSLMDRDLEASQEIYKNDSLINRKRFDIELNCLITIATQQAIARDLRVLASILEIAGELERMGDYAKGIARINMMLDDAPIPDALLDLPRMAEITVRMLSDATTAFFENDLDAAYAIPNDDDKVDEYFNKIYDGLVKIMIKDPACAKQANHLQWAAHNLERMADRVTNICERTIFVVTGEQVELDRSDDEHLNGC
jgi:phosphate transport system protein